MSDRDEKVEEITSLLDEWVDDLAPLNRGAFASAARHIVDRYVILPAMAPGEAPTAALLEPLPIARGYSNPTQWRTVGPLTPLPEGYARLIVTFGAQYAREEHATCPWAHPDGYLQVQYRVGDDPSFTWSLARSAVLGWTAGAFATTYDELEDDLLEYVPWGELACMVLP